MKLPTFVMQSSNFTGKTTHSAQHDAGEEEYSSIYFTLRDMYVVFHVNFYVQFYFYFVYTFPRTYTLFLQKFTSQQSQKR